MRRRIINWLPRLSSIACAPGCWFLCNAVSLVFSSFHELRAHLQEKDGKEFPKAMPPHLAVMWRNRQWAVRLSVSPKVHLPSHRVVIPRYSVNDSITAGIKSGCSPICKASLESNFLRAGRHRA